MADTKLTILGMSGSGKTCYLLSMYNDMAGGMAGYTLFSDDDTDADLSSRYDKMCDNSLGQERFPRGTDSVQSYELKLQYAHKTVFSFDWLDYPGEFLRSTNAVHLGDIKKVVNESSALFICVDGKLLTGGDRATKVRRIRNKGAAVINRFFSQYERENNKLPPTGFIVTKYDICARDTDAEELMHIIKEAYSTFFVKDRNNERIAAVFPVSIGEGIAEDGYHGEIEPLNMHLPIFMGIWFALQDGLLKLAKEKGVLRSRIASRIGELQNELFEKENKFLLFRREKVLAELREAIRSEQSRDARQQNRYEALIDTYEYYEHLLLDELDDKMDLVFLNGELTSFGALAKRMRG